MSTRLVKEAGEQGIRNLGPSSRPPAGLRTKLLSALFAAVAPILFYTILYRTALNIPVLDDYDSVLDFLNKLTTLNGVSAKVLFFLAAQHNEFKLFFLHGLAWLQLGLCGHLDFRILTAVGNAFLLPLAFLLWKMFLPTHEDLATRVVFFIPVSWLLFQLQYWEDLDWATAGLQHIPALAFSFGGIYLLLHRKPWAIWIALALMILAVGANGNGLFLIPIGVLILVSARNYARLTLWLMVSGACIAAYAYRYNLMSGQTGPRRSVLSTILRLKPVYVVWFMGSAGSFPYKVGSFLLGVVLCFVFAYMAYRGYVRRNPRVFYCVLFLLFTAIGVAGIRSDFGVEQGLSSRYAIYSVLLVIFAWFTVVEEFLVKRNISFLDNGILLGSVAAAVVFSLSMDFLGSIQIERRANGLAQGISDFEHPAVPGSTPSPLPRYLAVGNLEGLNGFPMRARAILIRSMELGVYRPPPL